MTKQEIEAIDSEYAAQLWQSEQPPKYSGHCSKHFVLILEPIDFGRLASAYLKSNWRWYDGFPNPERLRSHIEDGKKDLGSRPGKDQVSNSGGINIEWRDGHIAIFLNPLLEYFYSRTTNKTL